MAWALHLPLSQPSASGHHALVTELSLSQVQPKKAMPTLGVSEPSRFSGYPTLLSPGEALALPWPSTSERPLPWFLPPFFPLFSLRWM